MANAERMRREREKAAGFTPITLSPETTGKIVTILEARQHALRDLETAEQRRRDAVEQEGAWHRYWDEVGEEAI